MKIIQFSFENKSSGWRLEKLFLNKLTLLVGASGVGKSQILQVLLMLKEIANGEPVKGIAWEVEFETLSKQRCIWQGEFDDTDILLSLDMPNDSRKPKIVFEKVYVNDKLIVDRTANKILFEGKLFPKLSLEESIIHLLKEEDLKDIFSNFSLIYRSRHLESGKSSDVTSLLARYPTLERIQHSNLSTISKLYLLSKIEPIMFSKIKEQFISIFPTVEDISVAPLSIQEVERRHLPTSYGTLPFLQIKEKKVQKWIDGNYLSAGMSKTLALLSELYLCSEGTVFLIDEFENSLGVNCINEVVEDILASDRNLQLILTSHHPYIINAIDHKHWKLVTRDGGTITAHDMNDYNFGKSRHSFFTQLIQLDEYQTGQAQ